MGSRRVSLFNCVPSFAQGSDILLVHNDTLCLGHLSLLLRQCSFQVTATNQASAAIDMVCQQEGRFKLVMAKANMPDMTTISFLNTLLLKHVTVILVSSGHNDGGAKAAFDRGSCYFLQEPIQSKDLVSLWQQVYNSNNSDLAQEIHSAKCKQKVLESSEDQDRAHHDVRVKKKGKRALNSNNHAAEKEGEETRERNDNRFPEKKPRISWTSDLHNKFVKAISVLGVNDIRPKLIQEIMNVPYLTCRHIASHLQKFKSDVSHLQDKCNIHSPGCKSPNFRDGTNSPSSIQSQCYPGYPTLAAFQNEIQSRNHFPVNFSETETEMLENLQRQENQAELVNYGNQDLEAVVRGGVSDALMDKNQYHNFGNGFTEDHNAQNSEIQTNPILGNSSSPQKSDSRKPCCAKPSAILGELEPCSSTNQTQTLTEDKKVLRIVGGDSERYDCFIRGPDHITQNFETLSSYINGYNTSSASVLKAKPSGAVSGHELTDQNKTLTEHDSILRFLGEGNDFLCKGRSCPQNSEMVRNPVLGYNCGLQKSDNYEYNPRGVRLLKSEIDALKHQNQTSTENNNIKLQSDYCNNKSVRSLKAKPCSVAGGTMPDALMDHDKTLTGHNNVLRTLGGDSDAYGCLGNVPSSHDIAMLKYAMSGDC